MIPQRQYLCIIIIIVVVGGLDLAPGLVISIFAIYNKLMFVFSQTTPLKSSLGSFLLTVHLTTLLPDKAKNTGSPASKKRLKLSEIM